MSNPIRTYGTGYVPQRVSKSENWGYDIIAYGRRNTYPQEVEYAVARSGIASAALKVFAEFLYGQGFAQGGDLVVNTRGETLNKVLMRVCNEFALHAGFSLRMNANMLAEYTSIECEPFAFVRLKRPEQGDIVTQAKVSDDWAGESWRNDANPMQAETVDLFNPVALEELVGGMEYEELAGYSGQLLYFTMQGGFYDKAFIDPVFEQTLTSGDLSEFDRKYVQNGFSASLVFVNRSETASDIAFERNVEEVRKFGGHRNAGGIYYMEGDLDVLDIAKGNKLTDQYGALKQGLKDDICEALNMPPVLLGRTRQGGFPNQDEMVDAFRYYNGMVDQYRQMIAAEFDRINAHFALPLLPEGERFEIVPKAFIEKEIRTKEKRDNATANESDNPEQAAAQAQLRGSVGGVQGILSINENFRRGTINEESATTILEEIYGFSSEVAREIIGINSQKDGGAID